MFLFFYLIWASNVLIPVPKFLNMSSRHTIFEGEIKYFNKALQEYIIHFSDGSRDFVKEANFNETDLYFCWFTLRNHCNCFVCEEKILI